MDADDVDIVAVEEHEGIAGQCQAAQFRHVQFDCEPR
jgi:hypothetical protein